MYKCLFLVKEMGSAWYASTHSTYRNSAHEDIRERGRVESVEAAGQLQKHKHGWMMGGPDENVYLYVSAPSIYLCHLCHFLLPIKEAFSCGCYFSP